MSEYEKFITKDRAELWQAQEKLALAKPDLHCMKLYLKVEVVFHLS
jgi:hypothetical protein